MGGIQTTNRMRVQVLDHDGRVQCERGGERLEGALATNRIAPGVTLRLAVGEVGAESSLEIVGRPNVDKPKDVRRGLMFEMEIKRITRAVTSVPDPFAPSVTHAALPQSSHSGAQFETRANEAAVAPPPEGEFDRAFLQMESEPSGVYGSLAGMSLPEVLQSLEHGRRTATVLVRPKGGTCGVIRVESGRVIYASQGQRMAEEAFYRLASVTRGSFLIRFDTERSASMEPNLDQHLHWLLLEAARRNDEERSQENAAAPAGEAPSPDLQSALESAIRRPPQALVREDPRDPQAFADAAMADAFEADETRPALFSQFFTEAGPTAGMGAPVVSSSGGMSAVELDDELERARSFDDDRAPSGWTDTHSTPSFS